MFTKGKPEISEEGFYHLGLTGLKWVVMGLEWSLNGSEGGVSKKGRKAYNNFTRNGLIQGEAWLQK